MRSGAADTERVDREIDFFSNWVVHPEGDALRFERERRLLREARPDGLGSVLSLGCGRGLFETLLAADAERVLGIDVSPESIEAARARAAELGVANVAFERRDIADFAFEERFDTIVCVGFLHHLSDADGLALLQRMRRHLAPGGLVHTQDPNADGVLRKVGRVVLGHRYDTYHSADERELVPGRVRDAFLAAGYAQATVRYVDLTLIPGMQLFPNAPSWTMGAFATVDRAFCASPFARWASGFAVDARR